MYMLARVYDTSMTLILSRITSDNSIVLSADGMALNGSDRTVFSDSEEKVFHLFNGIHWSVAASGIYPGELKQLNLYLAENFRRVSDVTPVYTIQDIAMLFSWQVQKWFEVNPRDDLRTDFVLVGFSKQQGQYTDPCIYIIASDKSFVPNRSSMGIGVGDINATFRDRFESMPESENPYIEASHALIEDVSHSTPSVGGRITTIIIKGDRVKNYLGN